MKISVFVLVLAATLDYLIGDPKSLLHPVQVMGWLIASYSNWVIKSWESSLIRQMAGICLGLGLILGSGVIAWCMVQGANWLHPGLGIAVETILVASCFAGKSLRLAAIDVLDPLMAGKIDLAKTKLSQYVGRETQNLSQSEILRAILETIAENTTDGVTAPLFYAILGGFLPMGGSAAFALAYKAASTLDSMVGYRREPYTDLGWFSAKFEDGLTWLPCRFTVLMLALLSRKPQFVLQLCRRDGVKDPSPNSGWSECAFAAALGVQLGGKNVYGGIVKEKPLLGNPLNPITPDKIEQALQLMRSSFLIELTIGCAVLLVDSGFKI